jgi:hypothetical protein
MTKEEQEQLIRVRIIPQLNTLNCLTCGKWWSCVYQLGETVYIEVK